MRTLTIIFGVLLASSAPGADRTVFNDVEPREGFEYPSGTSVVVTADSCITVLSTGDNLDHRVHYAVGPNATFATAAAWDNESVSLANTIFAYDDTIYINLHSTAKAVARTYKFFAGSYVCYDTVQPTPSQLGDSTNYGFQYMATDGTNWVGIYRTKVWENTAYRMRVATLSNGRLCGATGWVNQDTLAVAGAATQHRMMAAPVDGGLVFYDQVNNAFSLIEKDGTLTRRCLTTAFGQRKSASTAIAGTEGQSFFDMAIVPVDPTGQGDTALVIMCDSTTNEVKVYTLYADTAGNDVFLVDSVTLSTVGEKSDILDSAGWRTPSITMAGTGCIAYYRDWADTTDLATVRIAYHVATDWADLSTFGSVQFLSTDSADEGTIGCVHAPQVAVAHNDTDSVYAYVVWNRWDADMMLFATYTPILKPGAGGPAAATKEVGAVDLGGVEL